MALQKSSSCKAACAYTQEKKIKYRSTKETARSPVCSDQCAVSVGDGVGLVTVTVQEAANLLAHFSNVPLFCECVDYRQGKLEAVLALRRRLHLPKHLTP